MSKNTSNKAQEEEKLEDILNAIRGIIDKQEENQTVEKKKQKNVKSENSDNTILELTDEIDEDDFGLISKEAFTKSSEVIQDFSNNINNISGSNSSDIDRLITNLVTPLLKEWIDNNLQNLVEKIIADELKKLVHKRY